MAYFTINGYDSYSGCDIIVTATLPLKTADNESVYFTLGSLQTLSISTHQDKRPVRSLGNINAKDYVMGQRTIAGSLVFAVFDRHFADKIMRSAEVTMADEIPALNLTINFANEYGRSSRMAIYGVKLINEGQVMSINDLYTENTYQFVALGMEPLTADEIEGKIESSTKLPNKAQGVISPYTPTLDPIESLEFQETSGKVISDKIKNNADYSNQESIILSSEIEQPMIGELTGIITLKIKPIQQEGYIYITNLLTNTVEYSIMVNGANSYNLEIPIGFYNARYMNTTRTKESNIEKIVVKITEKSNDSNVMLTNAKITYPVIESVSDSSIAVSMYDSDFDKIICFTSGDKEFIKNNNNKIVVFDNLAADSVYNIYAKNDVAETNVVTVTTFSNQNSYYNKFKDYLTSNRGMIQNDYDAMIKQLDSLLLMNYETQKQIWPYDNIIDGVSTLDNSLIKQELLLYAMNFENSMSFAYNANNPYKLDIIRNNIFDTDLSINGWESAKYYSKKDNKNKLEGLISPTESFNGVPNKAYSFYGINGKTSSVKHYITVFSAEGKEFLQQYKDVNKYQTLDLTYNSTLYPSLNNEELYAITIRDNFLCDKQLLDEPYVYIDNDIIYADVAYDDKVLLDDVYYLCMSEIFSTLDVTPKRKEPFNRNIKSINLSQAYMPFDSGNIYHFWIESSQGNVISKSFIFNYKQSIGLANVLDKELLNILNSKKRLLADSINNSLALNDIIHNLYCESVPKKDIDTKLEYALLEYGVNSYNVSNALEEYLYEAVLVNVSNRLNLNRINKINIYKTNKQFKVISGSDLDVKVVTKSYNLTEQEVVCNIYNTGTAINIKGDFMSIYLVNSYVDKILGFVVLDCSKYAHKELGFNVEVGDK